MDDFESTLEVVRRGPDLLVAQAAPSFEGDGAMFGGWTAALMVSAVRVVAAPDQRVMSLTTHFLRPVTPGAVLNIRTQCLKQGRGLSQWRCDLAVGDAPEVAVSAQVILGLRLETERFQEPEMPPTVEPHLLQPTSMPYPFFEALESCFAHGETWFTDSGTGSRMWARFKSKAPLTAARLAFLSDISPPRSFYAMAQPRPTPTVMMTVNFFATEPELAATSGRFVLCELSGTRMEEGFSGATGRIWTPEGRLLATTEQLQWSPPAQR